MADMIGPIIFLRLSIGSNEAVTAGRDEQVASRREL